MFRERIIKRIAKINLFFNAKKIMNRILKDNELENTDENILKIYKKIFSNTKRHGRTELIKIGKVYENGFKAVHNFNLDIGEHEFISLLGPSGCGKTTILRMIAGLELISEGRLNMGGITMNSSLPKERGLAMVFQNYALYPYMTVYENIAFGLKNNTYSNGTSNELLINTLNSINPIHAKIKLLKAKIHNEYNKNKSLINELKLLIRKEKKVGVDDKLLKNLKNRLTIVKADQKKHRENEGKKNIDLFKAEIEKISPMYPIYSKIKLLKAKIYNEYNKNKPLINELKILIRKEKKAGAENKILKNLEKKLIDAKEEQKKYRETEAKKNINLFKIEIKKLNTKIKPLRISIKNKKTNNIELYRESLKKYIDSIVLWKKSIPSRINYFSSMVGIQDYLRRKPHALSGGQRQRVALVRAISKDASLFLFDEPLSNLDAKLRGTMRSEIRRLHDNLNSSSVFVTHDQVEAMTMSDRIVLMNKGYVQQIGTPSELFNEPSNIFVADFIGSPNINFISGNLKSKTEIIIKGKKLSVSKKNLEINKSLDDNVGKKVIIGIRPQNVITDANLISHTKNNVFNVEVQSVESVGHENIVTIKSPIFGQGFKVVGGRYFNPRPKSKIKIAIDSNSIYIFSSANGFTISSTINEETSKARKIWIESDVERIKNKILSENEKSTEKLSRKLMKDVYGLVDRKYGKKRQSAKQKIKNLKDNIKDQTLFEQIEEQGGN